MLSVEQMNEVASGVTYKPGWSVEFRMGAHEGHHATIRVRVQDAYDTAKIVPLVVECFLSPNDVASEETLLVWLLYRSKRVEIHECREFLRFRGKVVSDPHAEGADADR